MNYVLFGSPGAGKGTVGQALGGVLEHFSSGDLLRDEVTNRSEIGRQISTIVGNGEQVPDNLVTKIVFARIEAVVSQRRRFILDGYPQTEPQFESLTQYFKEKGIHFTAICVTVSPTTALERMVSRVSCAVCQKVFSTREQLVSCSSCEGELVSRKSDSRELALKRLQTFEETTKPVMEKAMIMDGAIVVDGNLPKEQVLQILRDKVN